jgi:hypothetical protein
MKIIHINNDNDITIVHSLQALEACCKSYLLARGRCFACPGMEYGKGDDDDDDDGGDDDFEEEE